MTEGERRYPYVAGGESPSNWWDLRERWRRWRRWSDPDWLREIQSRTTTTVSVLGRERSVQGQPSPFEITLLRRQLEREVGEELKEMRKELNEMKKEVPRDVEMQKV